MELSIQNVNSIFLKCLFLDSELGEGGKPKEGTFVPARGVITQVGFHPGRIEKHKEEVMQMLMQLPHQFRQTDEFGGWSFLQACLREDGEHWAEHRTIDELLCLGLATGQVEYLTDDRQIWAAFPGGMPYFTVIDKK